MKDALEYYRILNISPNAGFDEIKHSYRELAKRWHPDYNKDKNTTDIFQQLSVAYETLSDEKNRLIYDILSLVYTKENYPDVENITPFKDGEEGVDIRALNLQWIRAWGINYVSGGGSKTVSRGKALRLTLQTALLNWLVGWWHPKSFVKNIKILWSNFKNPILYGESSKILLHNMIAYAKDKQPVKALKCGRQALALLPQKDRPLVESFLIGLNVKASCPPVWNVALLRSSQLLFPLFLVVVLLFSTADKYFNLSDAELWHLFSKDDKINYYQQVNFEGGRQSVDDVVVGKIMSIPLDKSDNSKLYHLLTKSKIMYGPSENFDVIKTLPAATTVRLTGYTPDKIWARVMIDNGETGFVHYENIKQGIGKEIPFGSSIIE